MNDKFSFHALQAIEDRIKEYEEALAALPPESEGDNRWEAVSKRCNLDFAVAQLKHDIKRFGPTRS